MKKIVNVNVGGFAFVIEESAYEHLNTYLNKVRLNLGNDIDTNEVMNDIEIRIAELFKEDLRTSGKEVVEMGMIEKVMATMGKPEDYGNGEPAQEKKQEQFHDQYASVQRQLFRNPDDKMLGGVCSGIGHYLGWDALVVRIIFVLLLFGFGVGIPIYIALWILVPEARSTADKLRMQGKPINVDTIKERFNDFKSDVQNLGKSEQQTKIKNAANSIGTRVEGVVSDFGKVFGKAIGIFMLFIGVIVFALLIKHFVTGSFSFPGSMAEELFFNRHDLFFENRFEYYALYFGAVVLAILILWGLISSGIELLLNLKIKNKPIKYISATFSTLAFIAVLYGAISLGMNYSHDQSITKRYTLPEGDSTIHVTVLPDHLFNDKLNSAESDEDELIKVTNTKINFGYPSLEIKLSETKQNYMEVERMSAGPKNIQAIENCENIEYPVTVDSNVVSLSPIFSTSVKNKFRAQNVITTLYVVENTLIVNDANMKRIFDPYNSFTKDDYIMDARILKMTKKGLIVIEK